MGIIVHFISCLIPEEGFHALTHTRASARASLPLFLSHPDENILFALSIVAYVSLSITITILLDMPPHSLNFPLWNAVDIDYNVSAEHIWQIDSGSCSYGWRMQVCILALNHPRFTIIGRNTRIRCRYVGVFLQAVMLSHTRVGSSDASLLDTNKTCTKHTHTHTHSANGYGERYNSLCSGDPYAAEQQQIRDKNRDLNLNTFFGVPGQPLDLVSLAYDNK